MNININIPIYNNGYPEDDKLTVIPQVTYSTGTYLNFYYKDEKISIRLGDLQDAIKIVEKLQDD